MRNFLTIVLLCMLVVPSCRFMENHRIKGNGNVKTEQRSVTGFSGVESHGSIDIEVSQGDYKVIIESDENIIPEIVTEVQGSRLLVHFKDGFNSFSYTSAKVYVTAPSLNALEVHGSGNVIGKGTISNNDRMDLRISGSGNLVMDVHSPSIATETNGSGNITLTGETKDFSTSISGSGDVHAFDLKAENVKTSTHGSGNVEVSATVKLDTEVYGSGDVRYKGSPQISSETHGSGSVSHED